jgi:hypothetical protein
LLDGITEALVAICTQLIVPLKTTAEFISIGALLLTPLGIIRVRLSG